MITYHLSEKFPELAVFTTTRQGGVSRGKYASFNLSPFTGDNTGSFSENLKILAKSIDIAPDKIIIPYQTHASEIQKIDASFFNYSEAKRTEYLHGIDALITDLKDVCIGVTTADCVPVFFYDNIQKVVAVAHAGWRGTCNGIITKTLAVMESSYNCQFSDIFTVIGPSVSGEVYKVGEELCQIFRENGFPIEKIFHRKDNDLFLDLWEANKFLLVEAGINPNKIEVCGRCTYSEHETFFSARRLGIQSGRMYSGISMR
jgi:polyphenol oxidase